MATERRMVQVICDQQSHPKRVAKINRFQFVPRASTCADNIPDRLSGRTCLEVGIAFPCAVCSGNQWRMVPGGLHDGETVLLGDEVVDRRQVYGTATAAPDMELMDSIRRRYPLKCPLCGLRADLRFERLEALLLPAATHGAEQVRLATLAAIL